jgi:hypothetical protein
LGLIQNLAITPDFQWIIHPALNLENGELWLLGLLEHLTF